MMPANTTETSGGGECVEQMVKQAVSAETVHRNCRLLWAKAETVGLGSRIVETLQLNCR